MMLMLTLWVDLLLVLLTLGLQITMLSIIIYSYKCQPIPVPAGAISLEKISNAFLLLWETANQRATSRDSNALALACGPYILSLPITYGNGWSMIDGAGLVTLTLVSV